MQLARSGPDGRRRALGNVAATEEAFDAFMATGDDIAREGTAFVRTDVRDHDDETAAAKRTLILIGIVSVLIAVLAATVLSIDIRRRARAIAERLGALRDQDVAELAATVVEQARDAFSRIAESVGDVSGRIDDIAAAASEVATVAEQSSASAEQVSASTNQTSASSEQIAASRGRCGARWREQG